MNETLFVADTDGLDEAVSDSVEEDTPVSVADVEEVLVGIPT